jgi:hypothetical protein
MSSSLDTFSFLRSLLLNIWSRYKINICGSCSYKEPDKQAFFKIYLHPHNIGLMDQTLKGESLGTNESSAIKTLNCIKHAAITATTKSCTWIYSEPAQPTTSELITVK